MSAFVDSGSAGRECVESQVHQRKEKGGQALALLLCYQVSDNVQSHIRNSCGMRGSPSLHVREYSEVGYPTSVNLADTELCIEVYIGNNSKAIVSHVVDPDLRQKTLWSEDCVPGPVEAIGKRDYTDCRCWIEQGVAALPPIDFDRWSRSYACVILPIGL